MQHRDDRLYIVTRQDLPVGVGSAQCAHAAFKFARDRWEQTAPWMRDSQYLVLVTTPTEESLRELCVRASMMHLGFEAWYEPDLGGQLTAAAFAPGPAARRLCANLPLLGRERHDELARAG